MAAGKSLKAAFFKQSLEKLKDYFKDFFFNFWDNIKFTNKFEMYYKDCIQPSSNFLYLATYITIEYIFILLPLVKYTN